ncbi:Thiamine-phosphate synthase [Candidatus Providencia siddallii]|uniref:Thiamine-phosphate synthase n=1 Tax=Candidatus Providencia siddallii TaxID=1715285 RepID=A0A0M6W7U6_9GAMM|nr:Thiamine-phosphate synthase [Candidatus Providencia siddallii]
MTCILKSFQVYKNKLNSSLELNSRKSVSDEVFINNTPLLSNNFPKIENKLGFYPIVNSVLWVERLLKAGVSVIQLRIKNKKNKEISKEIQMAVSLSNKYRAHLFINDYFKEAIEYGAYGIHLGQEDLKFVDLPMIHKSGLCLGISTHNKYELDIAKRLKPSYIAIGHIFPTKTKKMLSQPQGLEGLKLMLQSTLNYSTVAIGGISIEKAPDVLATGVGGISLVSAITQSNDWRFVVKKFLNLVEHYII